MKYIIVLFIGLIPGGNWAIGQTVTDYDGNTYNTLIINGLQWMRENLKVTHFNNGDPIPNITDNTTWADDTYTPALCYYNNDPTTNAPVYGALYNGYTVIDTRNVCPVGWRVPTEHDWNAMAVFLDGSVDTTLMNQFTGFDIGRLLKDSTTTNWWYSGDLFDLGNNASGFTALPGGVRSSANGDFGSITFAGDWWTATAFDTAGTSLYTPFVIYPTNP